MIKKEYIIPAIKVCRIECVSILAGSPDPDDPDFGVKGGNTPPPPGGGSSEEDEGGGSV